MDLVPSSRLEGSLAEDYDTVLFRSLRFADRKGVGGPVLKKKKACIQNVGEYRCNLKIGEYFSCRNQDIVNPCQVLKAQDHSY